MQIGNSVSRKSPDGITSFFEVKSQRELEYHKDLQQLGYTYTVIHKAKSLEACESCSS